MAIAPSYGARTDLILDQVIANQDAARGQLLGGLPDKPETEMNMILCDLVMQVSRVADALEQLAVVTAAPLWSDSVVTVGGK
jgi:hypothetical protein